MVSSSSLRNCSRSRTEIGARNLADHDRYDLRLMVRAGDADQFKIKSFGTIVEADITNLDQMKKACEGIHTVVHLAGAILVVIGAASLCDRRAIRRSVPGFQKRRYPAHLAGRRVPPAPDALANVIATYVGWVLLSPLFLVTQLFPVQRQIQIVVE